MTQADKNLAVIENFILHLTHVSDVRESGFREPQTYTPEELYRVAYDYIEGDHVDGKSNPENSVEVDKELNVAYGEDLVQAIIEDDIDEAVELIEYGNGDIVGFDGDLPQLFEHIRGSLDFMIVTEKTVKKINTKF